MTEEELDKLLDEWEKSWEIMILIDPTKKKEGVNKNEFLHLL